MDYQEFKANVQKIREHRNHRVTNSLGVYDCYKHMRKNHWYTIPRPVTEKEYYAIIRSVNKLLMQELAIGKDIKLPHKLGVLELRKEEKRLKIVDGKLICHNPIDWNTTIKLWYDDEEAFKEKIIVRREVDNVYLVYYNKKKAVYNNKRFYEFNPTRELKRLLKKNINSGIVDAFLLYKIRSK